MYEEEIHFGKLLLKQLKNLMVLDYLAPLTLTFDPMTPKSGWICGTV